MVHERLTRAGVGGEHHMLVASPALRRTKNLTNMISKIIEPAPRW